MRYRTLGRTGLRVSEIGFGCGSTAALFTKGGRDEQAAAMRAAIDGGINFFDSAYRYGMGSSETNLGETLARLGCPDVIVGTKIRVSPAEIASDVGRAMRNHMIESLRRLRRDHVELIQLHNSVSVDDAPQPDFEPPRGEALSLADLFDRGVLDALEELKKEGLAGHIGFTGLGHPAAVAEVIACGRLDTVQLYYNLLNPSAGMRVPAGFRYIDYARAIDAAHARGLGVMGIRALAGGALSEQEDLRTPGEGSWASGSWAELVADHYRARTFLPFRRDGEDLSQAAIRFALAHEGIATTLVGFGSEADVKAALAVGERPVDLTEEELQLVRKRMRTA